MSVRRIGAHEIRVEGDTVIGKLAGEFTLQDSLEYRALAEQLAAQYGTYYSVLDISCLDGMDPEARRSTTQWFRQFSTGGCALHGAGVLSAAVTALAVRAIALVAKNPLPVVFVKNEAEGLAWVSAQKQKPAGSHRADR